MFDVVVENVSKRYWIRPAPDGSHSGRRGFSRLYQRRQAVWALKNVSFQVERGEALGIIGHNGAGKSTILKLLSGISAPSEGQITICGRLSALVEVSSGFHPELTGRENIFVSGSILGMSLREIARKVESIIDFSGVRSYIDVPIKRYSSGMQVRLGFSIAAHLEPHILVLDEVLAVGDAAFQARCFDRIGELRDKGKTILFTSHDLAALERLCDRALLLRNGELIASNSPKRVIEEYLSETIANLPRGRNAHLSSSRLADFVSLEFTNPDGGPIRTGDPMLTRFTYNGRTALPDVTISVSFYWPSGYLCAQLTTTGRLDSLTLQDGKGTVEFFCPKLVMQPGLYTVDVVIEREADVIEQFLRCTFLRVNPGIAAFGDFYLEHSAEVKQS